jgi:hypothetical protein
MENGKQKYQYKYYYSNLAKKIVKDEDLFNNIPESWAKEQIELSAQGENSVPSTIPKSC